MKYFSVIALCIVGMFSCSEPAVQMQQVLARDTTIHPHNAFTTLELDSTFVSDFLSGNSINDSLRNKVTGFYNARNYQYAWFTEDGLSEAGEALWNIHQLQPNQTSDSALNNWDLHSAMQRLLNENEAPPAKDSIQQIELNLTLHFFQYIKASYVGQVDPSDMQWHIPKRKLNSIALLDSFLLNSGRELQPLNKWFYQLKDKLKLYAGLIKAGGWAPIVFQGKALKKGQSNEAVVALKRRLKMTDGFNENDTSRLFTGELVGAVIEAERSFGLKEDGIVTHDLINQLNVPAEERMRQLLINLERMRWLPVWPANRLVANIPEYRLHVIENDEEVMNMNIVVGKAGNRTVIFSDELEYVVFSPYWNVPRSIVKNEIVPAMKRNSNYISRNNMEITGHSDGLPIVRQKPGAGNALGRVKFIFPNRYNIYFHDTPAKTLFNRQSRAFSHGCVRVQKPFDLAKYLLRNDSSWTDVKIRKAMNSKEDEWVRLTNHIPVYLLYLTAWVDKDGLLNFRDDIYSHDKRMADRLFTDEKDN